MQAMVTTTMCPASREADPGLSRKVVDLQIGDTLTVGDATLKMLAKSGQRARLVVCAPRTVEVKTIEGRAGVFDPSLQN
jgi:hypothetical protein